MACCWPAAGCRRELVRRRRRRTHRRGHEERSSQEDRSEGGLHFECVWQKCMSLYVCMFEFWLNDELFEMLKWRTVIESCAYLVVCL